MPGLQLYTVSELLRENQQGVQLQLQLGEYDVVANFNICRKSRILIYEYMSKYMSIIPPGKFTGLGCHRTKKAKLLASKNDFSKHIKKWRKARHGKEKQTVDKNKQKEGEKYVTGAF